MSTCQPRATTPKPKRPRTWPVAPTRNIQCFRYLGYSKTSWLVVFWCIFSIKFYSNNITAALVVSIQSIDYSVQVLTFWATLWCRTSDDSDESPPFCTGVTVTRPYAFGRLSAWGHRNDPLRGEPMAGLDAGFEGRGRRISAKFFPPFPKLATLVVDVGHWWKIWYTCIHTYIHVRLLIWYHAHLMQSIERKKWQKYEWHK